MFNDNSKKILRYENLSNDLVAMQQQQQQFNDSNNNNSNGNKNDFTTNYNNTTSNNSYGYNVITGSKKYWLIDWIDWFY